VNLAGVYVPLITRFDEAGHVDKKANQEFIEVMLANGVTGVVVGGTTGEGYALTLDERHHVLATAIKQVNGRIPVMAGVGGVSTNEALDHAAMARRLEADGLMIAAPAYVLPTPSELVTHVEAILKATGLEAVLYDYPARTGVSFSAEVLDMLAPHDQVIGIKEASGDLARIDMIQQRNYNSFEVVCGNDSDSRVFFDKGVTSWIGGIANALPKAHEGIMNPTTRDEAFAAVLPLLSYIEAGQYNAKVKALAGILGLPSGYIRGPLKPATAEQTSKLRELVDIAGEWAPVLAG